MNAENVLKILYILVMGYFVVMLTFLQVCLDKTSKNDKYAPAQSLLKDCDKAIVVCLMMCMISLLISTQAVLFKLLLVIIMIPTSLHAWRILFVKVDQKLENPEELDERW